MLPSPCHHLCHCLLRDCHHHLLKLGIVPRVHVSGIEGSNVVARWLVLKDLLGQHLGLDGWGVVVKVAHSYGHVGGGCVEWVRVLGNHRQVEELLIGLLIVHLLCNNRESISW